MSLSVSGLVLAAAFVGISVQANAIDRESDAYRADIAAAEAQHAALTDRIAKQKTSDYVTEKARDYGYIGPNESLIAVQRDGQPTDALARTVREGPSRVARWIAFFFGKR
ncbi:MAG TPA: septum formation initiator family protein [Candidatus Limnocylindria bacterium]|nr:septum formation initiator family protein [Candidatus Limnocylindria bacterium]